MGRSKESGDVIHRSVRVFPVTGITVGELTEQLNSGCSLDDISLVQIVLARKNGTNEVTAIGGVQKSGESLVQAAMNRVFEKTLLTRESKMALSNAGGSRDAIPYKVCSWEDRLRTFWSWVRGTPYHREASLAMIPPVRSSSISLHEPRENLGDNSVYRIDELVPLKPQELTELFTKGTVTTNHGITFEMFGHLTLAPSTDVTVSPRGRDIQKQEFDRVLSEVHAYENELRRETIAHINCERRWKNKPEVTQLGDCGHEEIVRGFLAAKMNVGMQDEKFRDAKRELHPPKSTDLLTAALYVREFLPEDLSLAFSLEAPRQVLRAAVTLRYALRLTVEYLYGEMGKEIPKRQNNIVNALRDIWQDIIALPADKRIEILKELDQRFIEALVVKLNKPRDVVTGAMNMPERLPRYLSAELQKIKDTFQELHPTNEASASIDRPFMQMLYILGLDPYKNTPADQSESEARLRTRGEILMQLAVMFASIPVVERRKELDNSLFESGLASFVGEPSRDHIYLGGIPHTIFRRETVMPIGDRKLLLWVDKRPLKLEERVLVKSFQETEIFDDFSFNFVVLDENFKKNEVRDISGRIARSGQLRDALLTHYQTCYAGSGWRVQIIPDTHKTSGLQVVRDYLSLSSRRQRKEFAKSVQNGKRPGSIGNTIIREKFILQFTRGGQEHCVEVCIYPVERTNENEMLAESGLKGFVEKLLDDASGAYAGNRLIKTDPTDPTAPSVIELLFPAAWYRSFFDTIKFRQHTPKKKKQ